MPDRLLIGQWGIGKQHIGIQRKWRKFRKAYGRKADGDCMQCGIVMNCAKAVQKWSEI